MIAASADDIGPQCIGKAAGEMLVGFVASAMSEKATRLPTGIPGA
jgi:hypothetical protein